MAGRFSVEAMFRGTDGVSKVVAGIEGRVKRSSVGIASSLKDIDKANSKIISGFADTAKTVGALGVALGALAVVGLRSVMEATEAVADQTARIESVLPHMAGTVVQSSEEMKNAAIDWSKVHKTTAVDFLKSSYMMISAGLNQEQALAGSRTASLVASATFGDANEAAKALATQYNVLGDHSKDVNVEMGRLGDVMTRTQQVFQLENLGQLTDGLKYGTPIAKMFGQSLETLNTVMGMLNNSGITGTSAGTAYTAMMEKLIPASKTLGFAVAHTKDGVVDFGGTLANIHKKFGAFDKASDETKAKLGEAFGRRGIVGIALLADKAGEFAQNLASVNDNANAAATATAIIEAKGSGPIDILTNKFTAAKVALGDALSPDTEPFVAKIGKVIDATTDWIVANKNLKIREGLDNAKFALDVFVNGMKSGWRDAKVGLDLFLEPLEKLAGRMLGFNTWPDKVRDLGVAFGFLGGAAIAFGGFTLAVKVARGAVIAYEGVVWGANAAVGIYNWLTGGSAVVTGVSALAMWGGRAALIAIRGAQWAYNAALAIGAFATGEITFAMIAEKIATIASTGWTWLANTARKALTASTVLGSLATGEFTAAAGLNTTATTGMAGATDAANLSMGAFVLTLGAALAAVASLYAAYDQFLKLKDVSGGWEGMKAGLGGVLAGEGYAKGVDDYQNQQARAEAADRGDYRSGGAAPQVASPTENFYTASAQPQGFYGELTVRAEPGTTAKVSKQPSGGVGLRVPASGTP